MTETLIRNDVQSLFNNGLTSDFPSQLNMDVTEFCNLACLHCPYETVAKIKGKNRVNLSPDLHKKVVDEIVAEGMNSCQFVRYTGDGEPLLHPQLPAMISDMTTRTGLQVNLTTNGLLITPKRAAQLLDAKVSVFDVSIDAFKPETYRVVRRNGELPDLIAGVRNLLKANKERGFPAKVVVSFIRQPINDGEEDDFRTFWENEGVNFVVVRNMHSCSGEMKDTARKMWEQAPAQRAPCRYPWERLVVKPDGKIVFCPADWLHIAEVGHVATHTMGEVWRGEKMEALRRAHVENDFSKHTFCGQCPDWQVIPWPGANKDYASMMKRFSSEPQTA